MKNIKLGAIYLVVFISAFIMVNTNPQMSFAQFEQKFKRGYPNAAERKMREQIYNSNVEIIEQLNKEANGVTTYGVNQFSDRTQAERKKMLINLETGDNQISMDLSNVVTVGQAPASLNYLNQGLVTQIKDQEQCGSCWAFTKAGIYQSWLLQDGQGVTDLSQQYVLQCDTRSWGCDGGYLDTSMELVFETGIPDQSDYPYTATYVRSKMSSSQICSSLQNTNPRKIRNVDSEELTYTYYRSSTPIAPQFLQGLLLEKGPIEVGIKAGQTVFYSYKSGVLSCPSLYPTDHVVILIGWTGEGNWIIKNSWGTVWGQQGYGIIDKNNGCGLLNVQIYQNFNFVAKYFIELTASEGWNGNTIRIQQGNRKPLSFGDTFTPGNTITLPIDFDQLKRAQVIVTTSNADSSKIGFRIKNQNGDVLAQNSVGTSWSDEQVLFDFCPLGEGNCLVLSPAKYTLSSSLKSKGKFVGFGGAVFSFNYEDQTVNFGNSFNSGQTYGPIDINFYEGKTVTVKCVSPSSDSSSFVINVKDSNNNILFNYGPSSATLTAGSTIGTFNVPLSGAVPLSSSNNQEIQSASTEMVSEQSVKGYVAAIVILSILMVAFMLSTVYLVVKRKQKIVGRNNVSESSAQSSINIQ